MNLLPGFLIFLNPCSLITEGVGQGAKDAELRAQGTEHRMLNRNNKVSPGRR